MKTHTVTTYNFNELSDSAKENACNEYLSNGFEYAWVDDGLDSVKAFCALFNVKVTNWELSTCSHSFIDTDAGQGNFRRVKPASIPKADGCHLTGYGLDDDLLQAFHDAAKHGDVKTAFDDAIHAACKSIVSDMEAQESAEYIGELFEANEYQFLDNGKITYQ